MNQIIIISGMPGTGKTTFARHLAEALSLPLVCYDEIKSRAWECMQEAEMQSGALGKLGYGFFWYIMEMLMKSGKPFIAEYFFHPDHATALGELLARYGYKPLMVHFDADLKIAYERYVQRNKEGVRHKGLLTADIPFDAFAAGATPNRAFQLDFPTIHVNTNDFSNVTYEDIIARLLAHFHAPDEPKK